jgi:hypothetical protein
MSPPLRQLALQFAAVMAVLSLAWPYYGVKDEPLPWPEVSAAIGITALLLASFTRQPWWWRLIHGAFAPLAWAVALLEIDPGWFLLAALILMLVYRGALSGQIPLYLSNRETARTLADSAAENLRLALRRSRRRPWQHAAAAGCGQAGRSFCRR